MDGALTDAWAEYRRGFDLQGCGGHDAEAEAAYRRAIAGGATDAWLHLGTLLWNQPGRLEEAVAACRTAMEDEDGQLRGWAAGYLGSFLLVRGDVEQARACYAFAESEGPERPAMFAVRGLAQIDALGGDPSAARVRFETFIRWYVADRGWDIDAAAPAIARFVTAALSRPRLGDLALRTSRLRLRPRMRLLVSRRSAAVTRTAGPGGRRAWRRGGRGRWRRGRRRRRRRS